MYSVYSVVQISLRTLRLCVKQPAIARPQLPFYTIYTFYTAKIKEPLYIRHLIQKGLFGDVASSRVNRDYGDAASSRVNQVIVMRLL